MIHSRNKARPSTAQRLRDRVGRFLQPDEELRGAFMAIDGPRPGTWVIAELIGGVFGVHGLIGAGKSYAVIVTDTSTLVIRAGRAGKLLEIERRLPGAGSGTLGTLRGRGDYSVDIGGIEYWVPLYWTDEVRRLNRLG